MFRRMCSAALAVLVVLLAIPAAQAQPKKADDAKGRWAVLIGVDDYNELGKLRFAGNDQKALAEQLVASGFPQDQVFLLHDKATENKYRPFRENIEKQLDLVLTMVRSDDLLIVGFSGHGVQLDGKSYLCPVDARLDKLSSTSISLDSVYERVNKCQAALKLLLVDACRNDVVPAGRRSVALARSVGEFDAVKDAPPAGILLLNSCGPGQISMEDEQFSHGVFMHFVLEGLRGKAANAEGSVSLAGLYDYASLSTAKHVARKFNDYQTPALKGEISGPFEIGKARQQQREITNSIGMKLVLIPAGEFMMGNGESADELAAYYKRAYSMELMMAILFKDEYPQHRVRITRPFYLGQHEVTVGQFRRFVSDASYKTDAEKNEGFEGAWGFNAETGKFEKNKDCSWRKVGFPQTDEHPVVNVSWNDAVAFCEWLSRKEGKTYRLPTEAEWEYACRAGTTTRYSSGDDPESLAQVGNVSDATAKAKFTDLKYNIAASDGYVFTAPVGAYRPNAFGLYDMHGNVWEWCQDWYEAEYYAGSPKDDPTGPSGGSDRVRRGGGWVSRGGHCRSAGRRRFAPGIRDYNLGFRVAQVPAD